MRERPILFSSPMVRAILERRKTQTRRIVKWPEWVRNREDAALWFRTHPMIAWYEDGLPRKRFGCPYGAPGDRLWIKETWMAWDQVSYYDNEWEPWTRERRQGLTYNQHRAECGMPTSFEYRADGKSAGPWESAMLMPRWASRITLEVTGVRVERLQDISEEDAKAEGVAAVGPIDGLFTARRRFEQLWESINGAESWDANPFVWVVDFRRLAP